MLLKKVKKRKDTFGHLVNVKIISFKHVITQRISTNKRRSIKYVSLKTFAQKIFLVSLINFKNAKLAENRKELEQFQFP